MAVTGHHRVPFTLGEQTDLLEVFSAFDRIHEPACLHEGQLVRQHHPAAEQHAPLGHRCTAVDWQQRRDLNVEVARVAAQGSVILAANAPHPDGPGHEASQYECDEEAKLELGLREQAVELAHFDVLASSAGGPRHAAIAIWKGGEAEDDHDHHRIGYVRDVAEPEHR